MGKDRKLTKRTLERAGYRHVSGWVRRIEAMSIRDLIKRRRREVERLLQEADDGRRDDEAEH